MDGRGGCCIARYAGGVYDTAKIDRIMLRFRPIAPKPATGGSVSGGSSSSPEKTTNEFIYKTGRAKRKYVRDGGKRSHSRKKSKVSSVVSEQRSGGFGEFDNNNKVKAVTLALLPEKPVEKDTPTSRSPSDYVDLTVGKAKPMVYAPSPPAAVTTKWLDSSATSHQDHGLMVVCGPGERTVVMPQPVRPVGSCIIMECVTDVCGEGDGSGGLGRGDEEKRMNLERDTCPGLISDGWDRVEWTNEAYRKMMSQEGESEGRPEMVWLVMKERLPMTCQSFTCRVRVQYTCRKERYSLTVPCDVWKMNSGGLAWRLDVKAALSLGR